MNTVNIKIEPVKLIPAFKDYLWGGTRLKEEFNKKSDFDIVAESWELSAHKDGESVIASGEFKGIPLSKYVEKLGKGILGTNAEKFDYFPILIKFIDAKKALSVQVHPDDEYALENEGEYGKTEMWYILDCEEGASLYYGFSRDITKQEYRDAINDGTLTEILNEVTVHKGDVFFIPAGTVHAIGAGIVICEIQQNSNTTYRVYDYNRRDKDGNLRPLHIEKAIEVSKLEKAEQAIPAIDGEETVLASCEYFNVRKLKVSGEKGLEIDNASFHSLTVVEGSGRLSFGEAVIEFEKGDSIFVPAQDGRYVLCGQCEIILSTI